PVQSFEYFHDFLSLFGVQVARGLIGQDKFWIGYQGPGDTHQLLLAPTQIELREKQIALREKILKGLELVYKRLVEFKKEKNSELVIMQGDKIVKIKPWEEESK